MNQQRFEHINVMTSQGWVVARELVVDNGTIAAIIDPSAVQSEPQPGLMHLLPGIIDAHGDAFEREISPRSGSSFPLDLAIASNDQALVGAGITTFYFSITDGFEPGMRSRQTVRNLINQIEEQRARLKCDTRIHIRHEQVNTADHAELVDWLGGGRIDLLSLNNHLPEPGDARKVQRFKTSISRRLKMSDQELDQFIAQLQAKRAEGEEQITRLAALARAQGIPLASHDDATQEDVERALTLGVSIAEFPMSLEVAQRLRGNGVAVLVGAPNLVRGGSHVGALSASDAISASCVNLLCSDYHYASLFRAPFVAAEQGLCSFAQAWSLVSTEPAKALGIADKTGAIAQGMDADLLLLDSLDGSPLSLRGVWVKGRQVLAN